MSIGYKVTEVTTGGLDVTTTSAPPIVLSTTGVDINIDERASLTVNIFLFTPTGDPRDITDYDITWNATLNGDVMITKSTAAGSIVLADPIDGVINEFSMTFLPADTPLPDTKTYGTPMIYYHEGRLTHSSQAWIGIRGRMFIMPSQT
jgi:hypothetical protein